MHLSHHEQPESKLLHCTELPESRRGGYSFRSSATPTFDFENDYLRDHGSSNAVQYHRTSARSYICCDSQRQQRQVSFKATTTSTLLSCKSEGPSPAIRRFTVGHAKSSNAAGAIIARCDPFSPLFVVGPFFNHPRREAAIILVASLGNLFRHPTYV
jgi:hypothetical protein